MRRKCNLFTSVYLLRRSPICFVCRTNFVPPSDRRSENTRHPACRSVYYANPMHYSNVSRPCFARDGRHTFIPALFPNVELLVSSVSSLTIAYSPAPASLYKRGHRRVHCQQLRAIFYVHLVPATNSACSTNHNVELSVWRFHSRGSQSREWHTLNGTVGQFMKLMIDKDSS